MRSIPSQFLFCCCLFRCSCHSWHLNNLSRSIELCKQTRTAQFNTNKDPHSIPENIFSLIEKKTRIEQNIYTMHLLWRFRIAQSARADFYCIFGVCGAAILPGYFSNAKKKWKTIFRLVDWQILIEISCSKLAFGFWEAITRPILVEVRQFRCCETSICVLWPW